MNIVQTTCFMLTIAEAEDFRVDLEIGDRVQNLLFLDLELVGSFSARCAITNIMLLQSSSPQTLDSSFRVVQKANQLLAATVKRVLSLK